MAWSSNNYYFHRHKIDLSGYKIDSGGRKIDLSRSEFTIKSLPLTYGGSDLFY